MSKRPEHRLRFLVVVKEDRKQDLVIARTQFESHAKAVCDLFSVEGEKIHGLRGSTSIVERSSRELSAEKKLRVVKALAALHASTDPEAATCEAENLLLDLIGDQEVRTAFEKVPKL
jgi:hypothetical protein